MSVQDGDVAFDNDFERLKRGANDWGIISGLAVSERSPTPTIGVTVAAGEAIFGTTIQIKSSSTDVDLDTPDGTNPRKDIIYINSSGTVSKVTGTPEAANPAGNTGLQTKAPKPPNIPANSVLLAEIWVTAGTSEITNSEIFSRIISVPAVANQVVTRAHPSSAPTAGYVWWCSTHSQFEKSDGSNISPW